jgi:hypothetical protein
VRASVPVRYKIAFLLSFSVQSDCCWINPKGDKAALSGFVQFLVVLVDPLVFCDFGEDFLFLIYIFRNRSLSRWAIEKAEGLRRFRLGNLDRLRSNSRLR